jgi:hypothetical protein
MIRNALKIAGVIALTFAAACDEAAPEAGPQHEEVAVEELLCAQSNARSGGSADDSTADTGTSHNSQGGTSSGSSAGFADGHAWLAHVVVYQDGATKIARATTFGAWPDTHPMIAQLGLANGAGSDVRRNMEGSYAGRSIAFCVRLDETMKAAWVTARDAHHEWGYIANCASWAYNKFKDVTGEDVPVSDYLWIATPREFGAGIYGKNGNNNDGLRNEIARRSAHTLTRFEVTGGLFPTNDGRTLVVNVGNGREYPCGGEEVDYDVTDVADYLSPEHWINNTDFCETTVDPATDCGCHIYGLDDDIGCPQACPDEPCGPFAGGGLDVGGI